MWRSNLVSSKCSIAQQLANGGLTGTGGMPSNYDDGILLILATISAMSAEMWHGGKALDKKKFVQALALCPSISSAMKTISIPLLIQHLEEKSTVTSIVAATALKQSLMPGDHDGKIIDGSWDVSEAQALASFPIGSIEATLATIRRFSYAALLYKEIRCGYSHGYAPGKNAASPPTYYNQIESLGYENDQGLRKIYFSIDWIAHLAKEVALHSDGLPTHHIPESNHPAWWIDG